ncbi:NAD-dependent epimerase/dehydratase family protein [Enterocloster bolteae]|uniref:NAD-dependent epimerase/dehydratase family protein n=1 Tax=Enterocloster bolteae TaxID=208479 RepID=UPI00210A3996|nr:sugar nucleotide-binding protein [Enterocloster bolteae]MCQ5146249.1 sugar nucleotide-binding protein [Enterocloster bolteae]
MKIAIVGSSGYIAKFLITRFEKQFNIESILKIDQDDIADEKLNLLEPENFNYEALTDVEFIVFTAAISGPDKCAADYELCWKINVTGTKYFISTAIGKKCKVLFFSSDAVYGDIPGKIYNERSETRAETPYGKMKKAIEDEFKENSMFKAIRLSYVVSTKDKFISYCLSCIQKGEEADIFHPFYRNAVSVSDVVDVVVWLSEHWDEYKGFVLNVAGKELVSRVRMADEINRHLGNKLKYRISTPRDEFYKNRPQTTQMISVYMKKYNIIEDNSFTEKIKYELREFI